MDLDTETLNAIIQELDYVARQCDLYKYGLPLYEEGQMALMRERIVEILRDRKGKA
jgi:hypothetical protein